VFNFHPFRNFFSLVNVLLHLSKVHYVGWGVLVWLKNDLIFIKGCLMKNPGERYTIAQLKNHPFLTGRTSGKWKHVCFSNSYQHQLLKIQLSPRSTGVDLTTVLFLLWQGPSPTKRFRIIDCIDFIDFIDFID
jgi:serine/threonine protein kinase